MCWAQAVGEMAQDWPHRSGSRVLLVSACPGEVRTGIPQHTVRSRDAGTQKITSPMAAKPGLSSWEEDLADQSFRLPQGSRFAQDRKYSSGYKAVTCQPDEPSAEHRQDYQLGISIMCVSTSYNQSQACPQLITSLLRSIVYIKLLKLCMGKIYIHRQNRNDALFSN